MINPIQVLLKLGHMIKQFLEARLHWGTNGLSSDEDKNA